MEYADRAWRIVNRVLPEISTPHGFDDPQGFVVASIRGGDRLRLFYRTYARLRAKAEGGKPFLQYPRDVPALEGTIMWQVSKELEAAA